jgi:hypothetical protein
MRFFSISPKTGARSSRVTALLPASLENRLHVLASSFTVNASVSLDRISSSEGSLKSHSATS